MSVYKLGELADKVAETVVGVLPRGEVEVFEVRVTVKAYEMKGIDTTFHDVSVYACVEFDGGSEDVVENLAIVGDENEASFEDVSDEVRGAVYGLPGVPTGVSHVDLMYRGL